MSQSIETEVLVIGAGLAGLCAAISAREKGAEVLVVSNTQPGKANATAVSGTLFNAALGLEDPGDSIEAHLTDTIKSGAGLNELTLVTKFVEEIPGVIRRLSECGVEFWQEKGHWAQFRSPGHSFARTLRCVPRIGASITKPLVTYAVKIGVNFMSNNQVTRILTAEGQAVGALAIDASSLQLVRIISKAVILATGGAGLLYGRSALPATLPGSGYALALQAGCKLIDMEFVQYYPVSLAEPDMPVVAIPYDQVLLQGASFKNSQGKSITEFYGLTDPVTITRDQLTRAIGLQVDCGMDIDGGVLLDGLEGIDLADPLIRETPFGKLFFRFQEENGVPSPVKVAPVVHHFMGGVVADTNCETGVPGLLACGEVVGGCHGANRLQGNALSEAAVNGFSAGERAALQAKGRCTLPQPELTEIQDLIPRSRKDGWLIQDVLKQLQINMETHVGIVRNEKGLTIAKQAIQSLQRETFRLHAENTLDMLRVYALPEILQTALCIVEGALARRESRGAHYRGDYPVQEQEFAKHVVTRLEGDRLITGVISI